MLQLPIRSRLEYSFKRLIGGAVTVNPSQAYPPKITLGNLRFKTTVNGYGWTSTRDLG